MQRRTVLRKFDRGYVARGPLRALTQSLGLKDMLKVHLLDVSTSF